MSRRTLAEILTPDPAATLRWQAVVPMATNVFLLLEICQMAFAASAAAIMIMACGLWIVGDGLRPGDIALTLQATAAFFVVIVAAFLAVTLLFFRNRYFATFSFSGEGVTHEGIRGHDESGRLFTWAVRPFPVVGLVSGKRIRSKDLLWENVDGFVNFPSMRSIQLKRGRWHLVRLYTPDSETHGAVVAYLASRLRETGA